MFICLIPYFCKFRVTNLSKTVLWTLLVTAIHKYHVSLPVKRKIRKLFFEHFNIML
jgi:hypothetical protein